MATANLTGEFTPGDDLHSTVALAISALKAVALAGQQLDSSTKAAGLFFAVEFIAEGLSKAAEDYEIETHQAERGLETGAAQGGGQ